VVNLNLGTLDIAPEEWNFQHLSHNALYRLADLLVAHRAVIETHLARQARKIFSLGEKIILIAVSRSRPQEMPQEGLVVIKESKATTIQVTRLTQDGEVILA